MSSRCSICGRGADRAAIEADLRSSAGSLAAIAVRFGLSKTSLLRHRDRHMAETLNPVPNPAENQAPVTVRHRTRPAIVAEPVADPSEAAALAPAAETDPLVSLTLHQQRVRQSLMLRQQGYTRAQVARALEVSERTVTDWWAKAREESVGKVREATAEVFLADLRTERGLRSAHLYQMLDKAREKGDLKTQLAVHKLLEQMDRTNITLAASLGTFNGFAPGAPSDHDDSNAGLRLMQESFKEMAAILSAYPDDDDIPAVFQH
jgi:transposase-like protein